MDPERGELEPPSAGTGLETPGQQCPPNEGTWKKGRTINKVSTKNGLNTICRLNPLVIFPVKVRNSFNTVVLLYVRKVHAAYKMVEEHLCIFNLT